MQPTVARVLGISFLTSNPDRVRPGSVHVGDRTYMTRRVGDVPTHPKAVLAYAAGTLWLARLCPSVLDEHPLYPGWTRHQVSHAWSRREGTTLLDVELRRVLAHLVQRAYPKRHATPLEWRALPDVLDMIGDPDNPTPCTLFGKIPSLARDRVPDPSLEHQLAHIQFLATHLDDQRSDDTARQLTDALTVLYRNPVYLHIPRLAQVQKRHVECHMDAMVTASLTHTPTRFETCETRVHLYQRMLRQWRTRLITHAKWLTCGV